MSFNDDANSVFSYSDTVAVVSAFQLFQVFDVARCFGRLHLLDRICYFR